MAPASLFSITKLGLIVFLLLDGHFIYTVEGVRTCPYLEVPRHARRMDDNYDVGEVATFECYPGYVTIGQSTLVCRTDYKWSPRDPPSCSPVKCPRLSDNLPNGHVYQDTTFGPRNTYPTVAKYKCNAGYLRSGGPERRCQADGTWSGTDVICEERKCPAIADFYGGQVTYHGERVSGTYAAFKCLDNYDIFPTNFPNAITCRERSLEWSRQTPTCYKRLADLSINQPMLTSCKEGDRHGSGCRIWCETGYVLTQTRRGYSRTYLSEKTRTVHNGTLNHEDLDCEPKRCLVSANNKNLVFKSSDTGLIVDGHPVNSGTRMIVGCADGFDLKEQRSTTVECNKGIIDGLSSESRCVEKKCNLASDDYKQFTFKDFNSGLDISGTDVDSRTRMTVGCRYGEDLKGQSNTTVLCNKGNIDGLLNTSRCVEKRCLVSANNKNLVFKSSDTGLIVDGHPVNSGTRMIVGCADGFDLKEQRSTTVECNKGIIDGLSSESRCVEKSCNFDSHENYIFKTTQGQRVRGYVDSRTDAWAHCLSGHSYSDGSTSRKVGCVKGHISELRQIECYEKKCNLASDDYKQFTFKDFNSGLDISGTDVDSRTRMTVGCRYGEDLKGQSNTTVLCNKGNIDGLLNTSRCVERRCKLNEEIKKWIDHKTLQQLDDSSSIGTTPFIQLTCPKGQEFSFGNSTLKISCYKGGLKGLPDDLQCRPKACSTQLKDTRIVLGNLDGTNVTDRVIHGVTVNISCSHGYSFEPTLQTPHVTCINGIFEKITSVCKESDCTSIEVKNGSLVTLNGTKYRKGTTIPSNTFVTVKCRNKHVPMTGKKKRDNKYKCRKGKLKPKPPTACAPRPCQVSYTNGTTIYRYNQVLTKTKYLPNGTVVRLACSEGYNLVLKGRVQSGSNEMMVCKAGTWEGKYACKRQCKFPEIRHGSVKVEHEDDKSEIYNHKQTVAFKAACKPLTDYEDSEEVDAPMTCKNGEWSPLPCGDETDGDADNKQAATTTKTTPEKEEESISGGDDNEVTTMASISDDDNEVTTMAAEQEPANSNAESDTNTNMKTQCQIPADDMHVYLDSDNNTLEPGDTISTSTVVFAQCADNGYYNYYDEDDTQKVTCTDGQLSEHTLKCPLCDEPEEKVKQPEACLQIRSGKISHDGMSVTCDPGHKLNIDPYYKRTCLCEPSNKERPFTCLGIVPKCKPKKCDLPEFIPSSISLTHIKKNKKLRPSDTPVNHLTMVRFNCELQDEHVYEPSKRVFQCDKGNWIEADAVNWKHHNNGSFPSCRKVNCTTCLNGGRCIKDNYCQCPRFTNGDLCQTPVCPGECKNRGECIGPKTCACQDQYDGQSCQFLKCQLPQALRESKGLYVDHGSTYNIKNTDCGNGFIVSYEGPIKCDNGTLSHLVSCIRKIYKEYTIIFKTTNDWFADTNGIVSVNIIGTTGSTDWFSFDANIDNRFERNTLDRFVRNSTAEIGTISELVLVVKSRKYLSLVDDWIPSYVIIGVKDQLYKFEYTGEKLKDLSVTIKAEAIKNVQYRIRCELPDIRPRPETTQIGVEFTGSSGNEARGHWPADFGDFVGNRRTIDEKILQLPYIEKIDGLTVSTEGWAPKWVSVYIDIVDKFYMFQRVNVNDQGYTYVTEGPCEYKASNGIAWDRLERIIDYTYVLASSTRDCQILCLEHHMCRSINYDDTSCWLIFNVRYTTNKSSRTFEKICK